MDGIYSPITADARRTAASPPSTPAGGRRGRGGLPVLFDSGIRSGADIIKALALGATAVGIGRPYAYGLALEGANGIVHVLRALLAEADLIMAVDGYPTLKDLRADGAIRRITSAPGRPVSLGS